MTKNLHDKIIKISLSNMGWRTCLSSGMSLIGSRKNEPPPTLGSVGSRAVEFEVWVNIVSLAMFISVALFTGSGFTCSFVLSLDCLMAIVAFSSSACNANALGKVEHGPNPAVVVSEPFEIWWMRITGWAISSDSYETTNFCKKTW